MHKSMLCLMTLLAGLFAMCVEAGLILVENGTSRMPIVIFADAPPLTRQAADELAYYIEKVSGARPEVIEGRPDPLPESAIWVGVQPVVRELFPDLNFDFQHPEEILIAANDRHLVIAGRDRWDPEHLVVGGIEGVQQEYGTHNAVYTFLQEHLGVRWFWPGPFGEDVPVRDALAFEPFEQRYYPRIRGRARLFRRSSNLAARGNAIEWSRQQRLLLDSFAGDATHAFGGWWNRFHKTHPAFFALQPDGTRSGFPNPGNTKMCVSNPELWQQWLRDVETALEADPHRVLFSASPNDSAASGYCICESCRAWDHPEGQPVRLMWQGLSQTYVSLTDRYVKFANTLARLLRQRFSDRELYVGIYAYGAYLLPPVAAVPDDNVVIGVVASFHNNPSFHPRIEADQRDVFLDWGKAAPKLMWRPNLGRFARWGYLAVAPGSAIDDLRLAADNGVIALDFDMWYEHWAMQGPHYYMLAQMAWNPYADGDAILNDYYRRAFGPAADDIRAYWTLVEETLPPLIYENQDALDTWDAAFFDQAYGHLGRAESALDGQADIYRERVKFVRMGAEYWDAMLEARRHLDRFRAGNGQDKDAETQALAIWIERIRPLVLSETHPTAINPSYARPGNPRLAPYQPEALDARRAPWR